jgi:hypothetical protein
MPQDATVTLHPCLLRSREVCNAVSRDIMQLWLQLLSACAPRSGECLNIRQRYVCLCQVTQA